MPPRRRRNKNVLRRRRQDRRLRALPLHQGRNQDGSNDRGQGPMLQNFLRPLVTNFRNKLECLLLAGQTSLA
jgi:hypothetical protein